jgi:hypothetical protein
MKPAPGPRIDLGDDADLIALLEEREWLSRRVRADQRPGRGLAPRAPGARAVAPLAVGAAHPKQASEDAAAENPVTPIVKRACCDFPYG